MLRGCCTLATAIPTVTEGDTHVPQNVEELLWAISGSFWTTAGERVPRSGINSNTITNAPTLPPWRETISHMSRSLLALSAKRNCYLFVDRLRDIVLTELASDQHVCVRYFAQS
jgi:hypothetical protein